MTSSVSHLISQKFMSQSRFSAEIEKLIHENQNLNYIEAIIEFCERNEIELDAVPKLISKPLKEKLKYTAAQLNYLKGTSRTKLTFG